MSRIQFRALPMWRPRRAPKICVLWKTPYMVFHVLGIVAQIVFRDPLLLFSCVSMVKKFVVIDGGDMVDEGILGVILGFLCTYICI